MLSTITLATNMNAEIQSIGARIRQRRIERKVTQRDLCEAVGISENFLSQIENGRRLPSFGTLSRIATTLQMETAPIRFSEPLRSELKQLLDQHGIGEMRRSLEALQNELRHTDDAR